MVVQMVVQIPSLRLLRFGRLGRSVGRFPRPRWRRRDVGQRGAICAALVGLGFPDSLGNAIRA
jgi:hypothetical protein